MNWWIISVICFLCLLYAAISTRKDGMPFYKSISGQEYFGMFLISIIPYYNILCALIAIFLWDKELPFKGNK